MGPSAIPLREGAGRRGLGSSPDRTQQVSRSRQGWKQLRRTPFPHTHAAQGWFTHTHPDLHTLWAAGAWGLECLPAPWGAAQVHKAGSTLTSLRSGVQRAECSLGVCSSCGEEAKNRSPDVQRRKETPVSASPPVWLPPASQNLETPAESKAEGWAPVWERPSWPDPGAGGVSEGLVLAASRSKRAKGAPDAPTHCDEAARCQRRRAPGRAEGSARNRDGDRASPPVSTLRALGGCSLPRWTE